MNTFQSSQGIAIKRDTIKQYIDYLKDSFLIKEALRYDVKGRKYIGTEKWVTFQAQTARFWNAKSRFTDFFLADSGNMTTFAAQEPAKPLDDA